MSREAIRPRGRPAPPYTPPPAFVPLQQPQRQGRPPPPPPPPAPRTPGRAVPGPDGRARSPGVVLVFLEAVIDAAVIIIALILVQAAMGGVAGIMAGLMDAHITDMITDLPDFGGAGGIAPGAGKGPAAAGESASAVYGVYEQLRWGAVAAMLVVLVACAVMRFVMDREWSPFAFGRGGGGGGGEDRGPGSAASWSRGMGTAVMVLVVLAVFPPVWDALAAAAEAGSQLILNPVYSLDPGSPCPAGWSGEDILRHYNDSPFARDGHAGGPGGRGANLGWQDLDKAETACMPNFRMHYIIQQVSAGQSYEVDYANPVEWLVHQVSLAVTGTITHVFMGMVKSLVVISVSFMSVMVAVLADMLTAMVIAALPLLLVIRMVPMFRKPADTLLTCLPALYLVPVLSSIIVFVGAGFVASTGSMVEPGQTVAGLDMGSIYVWISSLGVLFLAVALPVVLVPMLGSVVLQSTQVVSSAVMAGAFVAGTAASRAMGGRGGPGPGPGGGSPQKGP